MQSHHAYSKGILYHKCNQIPQDSYIKLHCKTTLHSTGIHLIVEQSILFHCTATPLGFYSIIANCFSCKNTRASRPGWRLEMFKLPSSALLSWSDIETTHSWNMVQNLGTGPLEYIRNSYPSIKLHLKPLIKNDRFYQICTQMKSVSSCSLATVNDATLYNGC